MTDQVVAFVLAAGFGERLRPITNVIPKPLLPVLGMPVIERVFDSLSFLPVRGIGVNLHYKQDMIADWCTSSRFASRLTFFHEKTILGTGGGLRNASPFLKKATFLVHNADIVHDFDLSCLIDAHRETGNIATLAVVDHSDINSLHVDPEGNLAGVRDDLIRGNSGGDRMTFSGVAVYEPDFLRFLPEGKSGVVDAWFAAMKKGHRVGCVPFRDNFWSDIGSPVSYCTTVMKYLSDSGEYVFIHPSVDTCERVEIEGHVVIEKDVVFESRTRAKESIILPGSTIDGADDLTFCIAGTGFRVNIPEEAILPRDTVAGGYLIGTGGSDRNYFRVMEKGESTVLLTTSEHDGDLKRHLAYSEFFRRHGFPVPELIRSDVMRGRAYFQDLGDRTVYTWLRCPRSIDAVFRTYERIIRDLVHLHTNVAERIDECPILGERIFDRDHFRWETQYFLERYLGDYRNVREVDQNLYKELDNIASMADSFEKTIVHRDCQSQNIMMTKDDGLYFIDFQGARMGPAAYDIASLLWDPYSGVDPDMRNELIEIYSRSTRDARGEDFDRESFNRALVLCRLQRHMQALGAYSFLSMVKGKRYFLKFMPEALSLLKDDCVIAADEFPNLFRTVMSL